MTQLQLPPKFESTSAAGPMLKRQLGTPVLVGYMLVGLGTSSVKAAERPLLSSIGGQTNAGTAVISSRSAGAALGELRRLTGLTWSQLSRIFNVSRRSLHFWASGKTMAASNEEHLQRLLSVARKIDRGSAAANRAALFGAQEDGCVPFDLLREGEYEHVISLLGTSEMGRRAPAKLPPETQTSRAPRGPEGLVGALQDRIHRENGRSRVARSVRGRGGG